MKAHRINALASLVIISLLLTGCRSAAIEPTAAVTHTTTATGTATLTPSPTSTPTITPTITPTPESTFTASPSPTETVQWDQRGLSLTPIPLFNQAITPENVSQVDALAVWGNGKANTIALSPDNALLAVGTDTGVYLYESIDFLFVRALATPFRVQSIAFSPDGNLIALGQSEGRVDIYDVSSGTLVNRMEVPGISFNNLHRMTVQFSPDGAYVTSILEINRDIFINRWNTGNWQPTAAFVVPGGLASYVNPSADLIGIIDETALRLQSLSYHGDSSVLPLPPSEPRAFWETIPLLDGNIAPSPAGDFLLINNGNSILHWRLAEEQVTYRLTGYRAPTPDPCYDAPDTCRNVRGGFSWVCASGRVVPPIEIMRLTPDDAFLLLSLADQRTELRRSSNGSLVWEIEAQFTEAVFSTDMDDFYGLTPAGAIEKRAVSDGGLQFALNQHPAQLFTLAFSPDGSALAAGYSDGWIRVYSPLNGEMLGVLNGSATALQFSSDGRLLGAGLQDGTVRVFELAEGRFYDLFNGHLDTVTGVQFSPDPGALISSSLDCTTSTWDLDGRFRRRITNPGGNDPFQITGLEQSVLDESHFVLARGNGVYQVSGTGTSVLFAPPEINFKALTLSPNGALVALASTGPSIWTVPAPGSEVPGGAREWGLSTDAPGYALAFTPDGALLIVAQTENLAFWSVSEGQVLADLPLFPASYGANLPIDLAVSPDGSLVALARQDGLIHIFAVMD